jgi:mono/diheme cytochrome c family protein
MRSAFTAMVLVVSLISPSLADESAIRAGAAIYKDNCAACHGDSGAGENGIFPNLAGSAAVQSGDPALLVRYLLHGSRPIPATGAPIPPAMPAFGWRLDDAQAAAVLTYIRNSWGNSAAPVAPGVVAAQRTLLPHPP